MLSYSGEFYSQIIQNFLQNSSLIFLNYRLGRNLSGGAKGPGLFFILPCIDTIQTIDLRTITLDIPPQEILTKDSVTVTVDAVVYFRIFDAVLSVNKVSDPQYSTKLLAATSLRNILGTKALSEILTDKEIIAHNLQVNLDYIGKLFVGFSNESFNFICSRKRSMLPLTSGLNFFLY